MLRPQKVMRWPYIITYWPPHRTQKSVLAAKKETENTELCFLVTQNNQLTQAEYCTGHATEYRVAYWPHRALYWPATPTQNT